MVPPWRYAKNDLKLLRRHIQGCKNFPGETLQPVSKKDQMADDCECPIHARGYLVNEPNRVRPALGCTDWP